MCHPFIKSSLSVVAFLSSYGYQQMFINKDQLEDILTCQICFEIKEQPKLLSCHHSFCQKCLIRYWEDPDPGTTLSLLMNENNIFKL